MLVSVLLGTVLLIPQASATAKAACFPPGATLNPFLVEWFCKQLSAAGEATLSGVRAYRFAYIPSFHATRVVVAFLDAGEPVVVGKLLSGKGGYEPGHLVRTTKRKLSADEWRLLEQRLENAGLWEPPDRDERLIADGAAWLLEGKTVGRYKAHAVQSPTESTFPQYRKVGIYMLELADIKPDAKELY